MTEEEKKEYNQWQTTTGKKPTYSQFSYKTTELLSMLLNSEIIEEKKAAEIALDFCRLLCDYIQQGQIRDIDETGHDKIAVKLMYSLKDIMDNGYLAYKRAYDRGQRLTDKRLNRNVKVELNRNVKVEKKYKSASERVDAVLGLLE